MKLGPPGKPGKTLFRMALTQTMVKNSPVNPTDLCFKSLNTWLLPNANLVTFLELKPQKL